jgi:mannose-6-phosphate isomerase
VGSIASTNSSKVPERVAPRFVERVWGSTKLGPWFPDQEEPTGEVWFENGSLLIKFLFTTEKLSVQVHPDDVYAARHENGSRGKTEMWHILRAAAGASVALGFRERYHRDRVKSAAESGEILDMLDWKPARAGDVYLAPAGTVHALGEGLALCEIQQNSDVTYRMYDYGRGRELHLDQALDVARLEPYDSPAAQGGVLARCPYFVTEIMEWRGACSFQPAAHSVDEAVIILEGSGQMANYPYQPGQVWLTHGREFDVQSQSPTTILRTYAPARSESE